LRGENRLLEFECVVVFLGRVGGKEKRTKVADAEGFAYVGVLERGQIYARDAG